MKQILGGWARANMRHVITNIEQKRSNRQIYKEITAKENTKQILGGLERANMRQNILNIEQN